MVTIKLSGKVATDIISTAKELNMSVDKLVGEIINKYLPLLHTIDIESMADGYQDMGDINVDISEGNAD